MPGSPICMRTVWDEIDDLPHTVRMQIGDPGIVLLTRPDRGVQLVVIGDVVTVEAFRARLEIGRCIAIADAERIQIRHNFPRLCKGELPVELQPVGRGGDARMLHSSRRLLLLLLMLVILIPKPIRSRSKIMSRNRHYIFSGTLIPNRSRPRCRVRAVNSQSARRELRAGSSDLRTGQAS